MPTYQYKCASCGNESFKIRKATDRDADLGCDKCGGKMIRSASAPEARANETVDEYRGKSRVQGVQSMADDRIKKNFRKHDLPRIIEEHGMEYAKRMGFVDREGNPK